jgi:acyl-CoA synthetase (AMP-forming)/AMP-acid ligase II
VAESQESQGSEAQVSEAQIAVHWREEESCPPHPGFVAQANARDPVIFGRFAEERFPGCFREYADLLSWDEPWHTALDTSNPPFWKWFTGGRLNASYNKNPGSTDWRDWPYFAGDGAVQAADGYFRILGRVDDVINVAGHRLGTKEIESAALTVGEVAEAAAVPVIDDIRGRVVEVYVSLKPGFEPGPEMEGKVTAAIETEIGKIARPKNVWIVPDMPKTRSGKIMRRVIASISNFADVGDVTTLANPEIVEDIRHHVQSAKVARDDVPRQLTEAELEEIRKFGAE